MRLRDEAGVPMVYVSHDADEMRRLATKVVVRVQDGKAWDLKRRMLVTSKPS